jgi:hypothetical protein
MHHFCIKGHFESLIVLVCIVAAYAQVQPVDSLYSPDKNIQDTSVAVSLLKKPCVYPYPIVDVDWWGSSIFCKKYSIDTISYFPRKLALYLENKPECKQDIKSYNNLVSLAQGVGIVGCIITCIPMFAMKYDLKWNIAGLGVMLISIPISNSALSSLSKAKDKYNDAACK